ncbi:MAG: polysaccharide deacetylase family protein [Gemmatimonadales bacterium]|nr:MAG: polysaccharide deacetylase family protein [Gemmatimonadales bacterium]
MRQRLKRLIEVGASRSGAASILSRRMRGHRLVLAYHNVVPRGERAWGEASLHLPEDLLRGHLEVLAECCRVVSLERLLGPSSPLDDDEDARPRVAITFDDAYRGAAIAGVEALAAFGFDATFFINPGLTREPGFWWDRLAMSRGGELPESVRAHCLDALAGRQEGVLAWAKENGSALPEAPEHARPGTHEGLLALAAHHHISCECHTWSHPNLERISPEERATEFRKSSRWMEEHLSAAPSFVSYPYGRHDAAVDADAARHPYLHGFRIEGGWIPPEPPPPFAAPRLNVPAGLSPEGLRLRLAGVGVSR